MGRPMCLDPAMGKPMRGLLWGGLVAAALAGCDPRPLPRQATSSDDPAARDAGGDNRGDAQLASARDGAADLGRVDPTACPPGSDPCLCAAVHEALRVNPPDLGCSEAADPFVMTIAICADCGETRVIPVIGNRGGVAEAAAISASYTFVSTDGQTTVSESFAEEMLPVGSYSYLPSHFHFTTAGTFEVQLHVAGGAAVDCVASNDDLRVMVPPRALCP
jgi:hypothetical protein